jgi:hypothetical protein
MRTDDGWKVVVYPKLDRWQLFDLKSDPLELRDLANEGHPRFAGLRDRLEAWRKEAGDPILGGR